ncbi:sensor domain-containing diguanylate cyclase [Kineosporia sp. NBRC 101731]|uniref:sensor domain-containing diguanylate cyclase n=1 Tax=Kineosporia sp. NBRC 101731 TaxID=3032199 RepID=UPI002552D5D4|nr:sensor domain-containing diguanylate cyclase [Kineosporia sp. NBRC 101731]
MPTLAVRSLTLIATALVAAVLGWAGLDPLYDPEAGEPVWWPLSGFGAVLLVFGSRSLWPWMVGGLAAGATPVVLLYELNTVNVAGLVAGLCETLMIALLLRRARPRSAQDESLMDTVRVLACVLAGSAVASVVFAVIGSSGDRTIMSLWSEFARNHLLGLMVVSPCLAVSVSREELLVLLRNRRANLEWLAQIAVTAAAAALVFLTHQHLVGATILVLPLLWCSLRLGPLRTMAALVLVVTTAGIGTGHGPAQIAARESGTEGFMALQLSLGVLCLTAMVTSMAARLRERTMQLVHERTGDLNKAEQIAGIGSARWNPITGRTTWSEGLHLLLGTDPQQVRPSPEEYLTHIHPDDLERVTVDVGELAQRGEATTLEYRIVRTDREVRDVVLRSLAERRPGGNVSDVFTIVQDVTQARAADAALKRVHDELTAVLNAVTGTAIMGTSGPHGIISFFNVGAENLFGYRADEVIGTMDAWGVHAPGDLDRRDGTGADQRELIMEALARDGTYSGQHTFLRQDGSTFPGHLTITVQRLSDGTPRGFIGAITDLTSVLNARENLAESENRFRLAFDTSPMGMAIVSLSAADPGRFLRVNEALCEFAGVSAEYLLASGIGDFLRDDEHWEESMANLTDMMTGRRDTLVVERRLRRPAGGHHWGRLSVSAVRPDGDRDAYLIVLVEDITARMELTEQLQHEAAHDSLTGLPNRLHLHRQLDRELRERRTGYVAMLYLDLDGFKAVNDSQGHGAGDELLMQVADRIAASVRSSDVVARLGGDEFAVLCAGVPDIETAMRIGRSVLAAISREFDLSETRARVGASIGVAVAVDGDTGPELLHAADQAMYEAKRAGKGTVLFNERAR